MPDPTVETTWELSSSKTVSVKPGRAFEAQKTVLRKENFVLIVLLQLKRFPTVQNMKQSPTIKHF